MSSTQHQLIEQCATRLRGIVEALDNIHHTSPQRWLTDLDDVHSSAESLLALINDQAPTLDSQGLAGAALAQPSPAPELPERGTQHRFSTNEQNCRHDFAGVWWNDNGETKTGRECRHCGFFVADVAEAAAEQAEAERPEVVGYRSGTSGGIYADGYGLEKPEKLMTVAQHERIVGALTRDHAHVEEHLSQQIDILRINLAAKRDNLDAALAKVAELDQALAEKDPFGAKLNRISEKLERCDALLAARATQAGQVPQAWLDVQAERRRQIEAEGWTPEHDDEHNGGELADAAACYALSAAGWSTYAARERWPWPLEWWKPSTARRDLVKACSLALAEIERLDRAGISQSPQPGATTASS
ncbi:hypothetical protein ACFELH_12030 [Pseudomonas aeruginosa]|uniref:hypothetical protein n=1 Tax=Pseudomonas aeruginosa TaxID=287 RepID=UPI00383AB3BC